MSMTPENRELLASECERSGMPICAKSIRGVDVDELAIPPSVALRAMAALRAQTPAVSGDVVEVVAGAIYIAETNAEDFEIGSKAWSRHIARAALSALPTIADARASALEEAAEEAARWGDTGRNIANAIRCLIPPA